MAAAMRCAVLRCAALLTRCAVQCLLHGVLALGVQRRGRLV
jgi:hypothetical protein